MPVQRLPTSFPHFLSDHFLHVLLQRAQNSRLSVTGQFWRCAGTLHGVGWRPVSAMHARHHSCKTQAAAIAVQLSAAGIVQATVMSRLAAKQLGQAVVLRCRRTWWEAAMTRHSGTGCGNSCSHCYGPCKGAAYQVDAGHTV